MSKLVKGLITEELASKLGEVDDALFVEVMGLDANSAVTLRKDLREKNIGLMVVKKSLVKRAKEGTPLGKAMDELEGSLAICWGSEDFVSLAKEITKLHDDDADYEKFATRGGVMDGESLSPERVKEISKWPSRSEQLSLLVGQILGPGRSLAAAIEGPGATLASQIKQKSEGEEE